MTDTSVYLGKIGCDSSCQIWTGHRNTDWQVWASTSPIFYPDLGTWGNGVCDNAYVSYENIFTYNSINYVKQYWLTDYCPAYYYKTNE